MLKTVQPETIYVQTYDLFDAVIGSALKCKGIIKKIFSFNTYLGDGFEAQRFVVFFVVYSAWIPRAHKNFVPDQ